MQHKLKGEEHGQLRPARANARPGHSVAAPAGAEGSLAPEPRPSTGLRLTEPGRTACDLTLGLTLGRAASREMAARLTAESRLPSAHQDSQLWCPAALRSLPEKATHVGGFLGPSFEMVHHIATNKHSMPTGCDQTPPLEGEEADAGNTAQPEALSGL